MQTAAVGVVRVVDETLACDTPLGADGPGRLEVQTPGQPQLTP